ncbi:hypothetical protein [Dactylosporangium sp. CA-139066]|uniref:hypothetical protein n=1 Tax=Dactylosporangium sp. CA-139066 TaxID=3239930 RepID=UPI003D8A75C2
MTIARRDALLLIAAAVAEGMPCPAKIVLTHHDVITVHTSTIAAGLQWLAWFGMGQIELTALGTGYIALHNHRVLWWHGRRVTVCSSEQAPKPVESDAAALVRAATAEVARAAA